MGLEPTISCLKGKQLDQLVYSGRKGELPTRGTVVRSPWLSNYSVTLPAQAWFTLTLSFNESGPHGVSIEQECHGSVPLQEWNSVLVASDLGVKDFIRET